jgi:hypothetical protein
MSSFRESIEDAIAHHNDTLARLTIAERDLASARDELAEANAVIERIRVFVDAKLVEWRAIAESEK